MSGFAVTVEIRSARPAWAAPALATGLLLAVVAVLIADLPFWLRIVVALSVCVGAALEWRRARRGAIAPGIEAVWLTPPGDWRLVLDTGEMDKAELLHRRGFVSRRLVGLTLRRVAAGRRRNSAVRVWLTPAMLGERDWRLLQVRLRNP
ncbi:MAG: hypothetical protein F4222_12115 [Gammaproteobacteria bacterium]|nr:hypothetical protein [Gammaproteobacteria bacterium]MYF59793.1 hypothetical protein [Gammaproteobacteria bacterium]